MDKSRAVFATLADKIRHFVSEWKESTRHSSTASQARLSKVIRRSIRLAWWAITPWRSAERIRYLRDRSSRQQVANRRKGPGAGNNPQRLHRKTLAFQPGAVNDGQSADAHTRGFYLLNPEEAAPAYVFVPRQRPGALRDVIEAMPRKPLFSIVVPVYNTPPNLLRLMVDSVQNQWYGHWQLVLINDNSSIESVYDELAGLSDSRVTVKTLAENRRISGATNEGIAASAGEYIVFLDHDDELTPDCLYELALCINRDDPDFVYSDEDKIDANGSFTQPFFKPDWSPEALMSTMYTCHVACVRRQLIQQVGGLRSEYDGSQDWDFILRITEQTKKISHIPKVLYHWRIIPASLSSDLNAKPYAVNAGKRAREEALRRRGLSGELVSVPQIPGYFRTRYHVQGEPFISIIIPSKDNDAVLRKCVDSIFQKTTYRRFELVIVDNGSTKASSLEYLNVLRGRDQVRVAVLDAPFNFSEINNFGARQSSGELLLFLNDDTEVLTDHWLDVMAGYAQLSHVGAVGGKLLYPGGRSVQHAGIVNLSDGPNHAFHMCSADNACYFARNLLEYNWIAVTAACVMISREKFDLMKGFDENFPVAYNDVELCFRLVENGFYNVVCQDVELIHHESLSRGLDANDPEKIARLKGEKLNLYLKHPDYFMRDPFHNVNLASNDVYFSLPH